MVDELQDFYEPSLYEGINSEAFNPEAESVRDPGFLDALKASFTQDNELVSYIVQERATREALAPKYEKFSTTDYQAKAKELGYTDDKDLIDFINVDSDAQFESLMRSKEYEREQRQLIENSGGYGYLTSFIAGATNPTTLAAAVVAGPSVLASKTFLGGAAKTAGVGLVETAVSETLLHQTQTERTAEESYFAVGGSTILSGLLGGVSVSAIRAAEARTGKRMGETFEQFRKEVLETEEGIPSTLSEQTKMFTGLDSASAARKAVSMEDLRLIGEGTKIGKAILGNPVARKLSVVFDLGLSQSRLVRESLYKLADTNILTTGTERGLARPESAEIIGEMRRGVDAKVTQTLTQNYKEYRDFNRGSGNPIMNPVQFREEIGKAMHLGDNLDRADIAPGARKYAEKAMKDIREQQKKIEQMLQARGLLPENVKPGNAQSYLHVRWDPDKIAMNRPLWKKKLSTYFTKEFQDQRKALIADGSEAAQEKLATQFDERFIQDYIDEAIEEVTGKIEGPTLNGRQAIIIDAETSPFKKRALNVEIDEDMVKFMDTDAERAMSSLSKYAFGRVGLDTAFEGKSLKQLESDIKTEYDELAKDKSGKELAKLEKERKRHLDSIGQLWNLNLGTFDSGYNPDSIISRSLMFAKNLNFMRFMGDRLQSSLPDISMPIFVHGLGNLYGDAIKPLMGAKMNKALKKALKEAPEEMEDFALALEHVLNIRNQEVWGVSDPMAKGSALERLAENGAAMLSKVSGANWWDNTMKSVAHIASQNRLLRIAETGDIDEKSIKLFARHGLDVDDIKEVSKQFKKHGSNVEGFRVANYKDWDNQALAGKVKSSLFRMNRSTILNKGFADTPLRTNTAIGGVVTQFMTHAFASNQRILTVAAQMGPRAEVLQGMMALTSLGMMVSITKDVTRGRDPDLDPGNLLVAGVDRSGIAAIPMYMRGIGQKFGVDPLSYVGLSAPSRYAQFNKLEQILGPTASLYTDVSETTSALSKIVSGEELAASDVKNITIRSPLNVVGTLPGFSYLMAEGSRMIDEKYK